MAPVFDAPTPERPFRMVTAPARPDLPKQRIRIEVVNIPAYTREPLALVRNYDFLPDGYADTLVMAETLPEIMADKLVSLVNTQRYIRYRDIWDLRWLAQREIQPDGGLVARKIEDYGVSAYPGNSYATWSGTSFSTPLTSGAAALVRAADPDSRTVRTTIENTALDVNPYNPLYVGLLGKGRIRPLDALVKIVTDNLLNPVVDLRSKIVFAGTGIERVVAPAIEAVEIVRGSASALYGDAAIGAVIATDTVMEPFLTERGMYTHGITFGGHPVACAVALKNLEIMKRERIVEGVREHEEAFRSTLAQLLELPIAGDLRGTGFFYALELVKDKETRETFNDVECNALLRGFVSPQLCWLVLASGWTVTPCTGVFAGSTERDSGNAVMTPPISRVIGCGSNCWMIGTSAVAPKRRPIGFSSITRFSPSSMPHFSRYFLRPAAWTCARTPESTIRKSLPPLPT